VLASDATELAALSAEGRLLIFPLEEIKELPSGGRGVMAMKLHDGETMLGLRPVSDPLLIGAIGRGDKRVTLEIQAKKFDHYRGNRARSGRKLEPYFKKVDGFEQGE
jgi:topoisomerase-4 subunit A